MNMDENKLELIFNDIYDKYEEYCFNHSCCNVKRFYKEYPKCKYEDYNRGLIDGKIPCRDCKIAFTIDYLKSK